MIPFLDENKFDVNLMTCSNACQSIKQMFLFAGVVNDVLVFSSPIQTKKSVLICS